MDALTICRHFIVHDDGTAGLSSYFGEVKEYDEALWHGLLESLGSFDYRTREIVVRTESVKKTLIALCIRYRSSTGEAHPLGTRQTTIGLSLAAGSGNRIAVKAILSSPVAINKLGLDHALFFAAYFGQEAAIPELLERGATVNGCSYGSIGSSLQAAVKSRKQSIVQLILRRGGKNDGGGSQGTALHIAARQGSTIFVDLLLKAGFPINHLSEGITEGVCHESPILTAILNDQPEMMRYLKGLGADINIECPCNKFTPMRSAAKIGNAIAVRALLDAGANAYAGMFTALHDATYYGRFEVVKLLLERGVDVNHVSKTEWDNEGLTALDSAINDRSVEDHRPNMFSIIRLLLQNGAKTRAGLDVETDLIHRWAMLKHPKMRGHNTLDLRDRKDFEEILIILLERGLDIDGTDGNGRTPLHSALMAADSRGRSSWGYTDPHNPMLHLRLLLDHGANPNLKDKSGKTPLEIAECVKWDAGYMSICPPWEPA